jgi:hypothetical protein
MDDSPYPVAAAAVVARGAAVERIASHGGTGGTHQRPNVDMTGIHRDLARYYTAYGLFDTSTPDMLFERVVWPNMTPLAKQATTGHRNGATRRAVSTHVMQPPPTTNRSAGDTVGSAIS